MGNKVCKKYVLALVLLCAIAFSISACSGGEDETEGSYCFEVGYLDITASAPLFIAKDLNLFEENDVCVNTNESASSNQLVNSLAAGRLDYVVETSAAPALALESEDPGRFYITAASEITVDQPFDAIMVKSENSPTDLEGLENKTVAVFPGTTAENLVSAYLSRNGVDAETINFTPTPPSNWIAAVKSGSAYAAHVYEPAWTIARNDPSLAQIHGTVYGRQLSPNPQGISIINSSTADEYTEESKSLVNVFDSTLAFMKQKPDSVKSLLEDDFDLPGNTVEKMNLLYMSPHKKINWKSIKRYSELLQDVGELKESAYSKSIKYE